MSEELVIKYIKTKNKIRKITTYKEHGELWEYHKKVVKFLRDNTYNSVFAKAYIPHGSIFQNAKAHMYNDIFIKMDIKDFFPSINHKYMAERLYFEINKNTNISRKECYNIVRRCSVGHKGLPLGLVSSPALANLYLKEFDGLLYGKIKKMGLNNPIYTRYADDMVISFKYEENYSNKVEEIKQEVTNQLRRTHLKINVKKTKLYNLNDSNHVRITGINIVKSENDYRHISVGKKLKNKIFWDAINIYDAEEKDYNKIMWLKGTYSFVSSIEKEGIESCFSNKMNELIYTRGYSSLRDLINSLDTE